MRSGGSVIERRWDREAGISYVSATGLWTVDEVDAHYAALRRLMDDVRAAGHPVRIISDISRAQRQMPEVEVRATQQIADTFKPGDRVAFVTADADDKLYLRSRLGSAEAAAFSSLLTAEMWLFSDAEKP